MEHIILSIIGLFVATLPIAVSFFLAKHTQLRADTSRLKEEYYIEFIKALSNNVLASNRDKSKIKLANARNHILLIGSSDVVAKLIEFDRYTSVDNKNTTKEKHDLLLTDLIKSMRNDLYKKSKINIDYPTVSLSGTPSKKGE